MSVSKAIILGGDGFIGSYYAKHQRIHDNVVIISRKKSIFSPNEIIFENLFSLPSSIFENVDIVYNFLGLAHVTDKKNQEAFYNINYTLVLALATQAKQAGVSKFIHMSSISVYGLKKTISLKTIEEPFTNYGKSKLLADRALLEMADDHFQVLLLRPPMIYGSNAPGNMRRLIDLVIILPILPFKNATSKRESLCVQNFMCILENMVQNGLKGIQLLKDIESFSTYDLVKMINSTLKFRKPIIRLPFSTIISKVFPSEYLKLFSVMDINLSYDICKIPGLIDPRIAFCEMVRNHKSPTFIRNYQ